jgi:hypothetical protein
MGHYPTLTCTTIFIIATIIITITITIISATWQAGVQKLAEENSTNAVQLHFEGAQGLTVFHSNSSRNFATVTAKLYGSILHTGTAGLLCFALSSFASTPLCCAVFYYILLHKANKDIKQVVEVMREGEKLARLTAILQLLVASLTTAHAHVDEDE